MAVRAVTPSNEVHCSSCGAVATLEDNQCPGCGEQFTGTMDAGLCGSCHAIVTVDQEACSKCGAQFSPVKTMSGFSEDEFLRRMLKWRGLPARESQKEGAEGSPSQVTAPDTSTILWQLFEPLEKVLRYRKSRLEHVDSLIVEARKRISSLENSHDPDLQRERWRLRAWVDEITAERKDLSTIEESMMDMERTYRNIISMQQAELHTKEESIKSRLESFRSEIERIEKEKVSIREKEEDIGRKEEEFRKILGKISEKEMELAAIEEKLREKAKEVEEQASILADLQKQMEKEKWMAAQRQVQAEMLAIKSKDLVAQTEPPQLAAINSRVTELEEQMEVLTAEKERLMREGQETKEFLADVGKVLRKLDDLLGQLPPDAIRKFAKGSEFELYERVLERYGV